ncbi:MAG: amidohydrolase family protein [Candidatus Rokuibacteriota bacterium]
MTVIDVHTHMLSEPWLDLLKRHGAPRYEVRPSQDAPYGIFLDGAPFMTPQPGHWDYKLRIKEMDRARVDLALISLTAPNVYFGGPEVSLRAAQAVNDEMTEAQGAYPDRIRFLASLPWEHAALAVRELDRACARGAVGVMVLANVAGLSLTDPRFAPIWEAIDARALPVLVHPTAPPGTPQLDVRAYNLIASVGFMLDTTLAITRMIFDGFLDRYRRLRIIAAHAGATLPYLVGRLDVCFDKMNACRVKIATRPSTYLRRIWYDSIAYTEDALRLCLKVAGPERVLYGSDYPHNIGDMKGLLRRVNGLPARTARMVRQTNAERIFRL